MIKKTVHNIVKSTARLVSYCLDECTRREDVREKKRYLQENGFPLNESCPEEQEYIHFWKQFSPKIDPYCFRFYSHFMGKTNHIIPDNVGHKVLEYYLNPIRFRDFYNDKCIYNQLFMSNSYTPKMIFCRIDGGVLLDEKYRKAQADGKSISYNSSAEEIADYIRGFDSVILKPSIDSKGGQGIEKFIRQGNVFVNTVNTKKLSGFLLKSYGNNFVVQESIQQHPFLAQFNPTSVNTLRVCTYRSVVDEEVIVFACALRMGTKGSFTDNTHSGGVITKVNLETGKIGNCVYGKYRKRYSSWNDIDFEKFNGYVPNWSIVLDFAKDVASKVLHMRLLSLDISLRQNGDPILIEINVNGFSFGLPMCLNQPVFGERFDEVIDYCKDKLHKEQHD